ncbi:MAG: ribonuclease P protein component [Gammaproteobacteria bacterium]|nr:ribonuclease P protein component [Gammaproteobacteria bacterium]
MATQSFPKASRLLNAADYSAVFDQTHFKVSCRYFLILARLSHDTNTRLGLIVAKKNIPAAIQRNRMKRLIRTSFRSLNPFPRHLDLIVLVRKGADEIHNRQAFALLNTLWSDVALKCQGTKSQRD